MLQEAMHKFPEEAFRRYMGNNRFSVTLPIHYLEDISVPVSIMPREKIILLINQKLSGTGDLKIQYVNPRAKNPQNRQTNKHQLQNEEPPYLQMELLTRMPPSMMATFFDLPGLKVQNIEWNLRAKTWIYKAKVLIDSPELRQAQGIP